MRRNLTGALIAVIVILVAIFYLTRGTGSGAGVPASETAFINGMTPIMTQVQTAGADLAGWRQKRAAMICQTITGQQVTDWLGTVVKIDSTITGGAVFAVSVLPNVDFGTAPNAISNISSNTLISPDSPLYHTIGTLAVGQKVRFTGQLFSSPSDCIQEASVTDDGSMRNPLFVTRFVGITALPAGP